jgi:hypothetical protein
LPRPRRVPIFPLLVFRFAVLLRFAGARLAVVLRFAVLLRFAAAVVLRFAVLLRFAGARFAVLVRFAVVFLEDLGGTWRKR